MNKKGFTMVELMVVVIIVGILASAAVPLYTKNVSRAIATEAIATLGAIRGAERIYKMEFGTYTSATSTEINFLFGLGISDVHYFDEACYEVTSTDPSHFIARCDVSKTTLAPGAAQAKKWLPGVIITIDEKGVISE